MWELLFGPEWASMAIFGAIASGIGSIAGKLGLGKVLGKVVGGVADNAGAIGSSAASIAADKYMLEKKHQFSKREAQKARDFSQAERIAQQGFSAEQAAKQMAFQERMASTQTQRASKDMEKAGLNRILALGSPAIAPQGAMASAQQASSSSASASSAGEGAAAVGNAIRLASAKQTIKLQQEQIKKTAAEARTAGAQADFYEMLRIPASMLMDWLGRDGASSKGLLEKAGNVMRAIGGAVPMKDRLTGNAPKNVIEINSANHPNDRTKNWDK